MNLREKLLDLEGAAGGIATYAPDEYPEWDPRNYSISKPDIEELWAEIQPKLKRDLDKAQDVAQKIKEGFEALDNYLANITRGEAPDHKLRERGRDAFWHIYNMHLPRTLR